MTSTNIIKSTKNISKMILMKPNIYLLKRKTINSASAQLSLLFISVMFFISTFYLHENRESMHKIKMYVLKKRLIESTN